MSYGRFDAPKAGGLVLASILLVAGCALPLNSEPIDRAEASSTAPNADGASGGPPEGVPTIAERAEQATPEQRPFFDDGVINFAEYQEAVLAAMACVKAQGFIVDAQIAADGFYQYSGAASDGVQEALDSCRSQWSKWVEIAYQESQGPSADELPAVDATISCLIDAGEVPSNGTRVDQLRAFIAQLPVDSPARTCEQLLPT